jgi:sulfatase maturation enzyme AslB (radical SAM superfamily)
MTINVLHIESTEVCNAACPQCLRETDKSFNKLQAKHLSLKSIQKIISEADIKALDKMFMCGNYGDPAAGKHPLEIFKYFRSINPTIILGMNTNGGLRSTKWWAELANILNQPMDYVVWSIDGLEDTNHIYRINVKWDTIIKNVQSFIANGGNAHWDMLVFAHNEHQIDTAEQYAKLLGFKWFRAKVSRRFEYFPVEFLAPPSVRINFTKSSGPIICHALTENSNFLSAQGILYPCCWMGGTEYTLDKFDSIKQSWGTTPNKICSISCTKNNAGTDFTNQWQREIEFK